MTSHHLGNNQRLNGMKLHFLALTSALTLWISCNTAEKSTSASSAHEHEGEKHEGHEHEKEGEKHEDHEGHEHEKKGEEHNEGATPKAGAFSEVHLTQEALKLAGIVVGKVERRALSGGVGIPAEVQFEPTSTAHVGPLVQGRITKVNVALGDRVTAGQLLGVVASSDVSAAGARLGQAKAQLSAAESTLARQQQLSAEGIGAQRSLIDAEARVNELKAEVAGLRSQLSLFGSGAGGGLVLTAPIDGIVVSMHGTLGETASPDEPVFVVTDPTKVWVRGNVPELEIGRATVGEAVSVRLHAFPNVAMKGTITYVAPSIDEPTRSLPIRVKLELPDPRLRSGLFGIIELVGGALDERVAVIPADAVATVDGQTVAFVQGNEPGAFQPTPVLLGRRAGAFFELKAGLPDSATVALSGGFRLKSVLKSGEIGDDHGH